MDRQFRLLERLADYAPSVPFSADPVEGLRYGFSNGAFKVGDGTMWHVMLRYLRTRLLAIEASEWRSFIVSFGYFFVLLACYYTMRPLRDALAANVMILI